MGQTDMPTSDAITEEIFEVEECPRCGRYLVFYWDGDDHGAMCTLTGGCGFHARKSFGGPLEIVEP